MELIGTEKINILSKRELERQLNVQKRKDDKDLISADNEKIDFFQNIFTEKENYIKKCLNKSSELTLAELPHHFNAISKEVLTLQKYVAASNIFLRNYDIKKCHQKIQDLTIEAKMLEEKLLPKKKFGFKSKSKQKTDNYKNVDQVDSSIIESSNSAIIRPNLCGFFNKTNENLTMSSLETFKKDVAVENLQNCRVKLYGSPSTLHLSRLKGCKVFCGPVSTSIFAENCEECTLIIACQQLRLHSSKNVHIYLQVTSRAIMEDCTDILIAPYNWEYTGIENDFKKATLDITSNNWRCVDDFNWLNIEKPSPNWREIPVEDRISDWNL